MQEGAFAAWPDQREGTAEAVTSESLSDARLEVGEAVRLDLLPTAQVTYAAEPGKAEPDRTFGGMAALEIGRAGTYRVALGGPAWIDVVQDGTALASTAHGHGPQCSGIRKIVDFDLQPGRYIVQIAASATDTVSIMVVGPAGL